MSKPLTPEEEMELLSSPYVLKVSHDKVLFSPEFKEMAYQELLAGKPIRKIFEDHGIDPEILGDGRIYIFTFRLRQKAKKEGAQTDLRKNNKPKAMSPTAEQSLKKRVEQLEHELAYTQQEVEFLKKIHMADLEARKSWESKHRQK